MEFKTATMADFDVAFDYIEKLWTYNTYDKEVIRKVYADVLADENSFAFFLMDGDTYHGFCHGAYFNTFWLSGMTCYVSSIITNEDERGKGVRREAHGPRQGTGPRPEAARPWCWTPVCPGPRPTGSMRSTDLKKAATALTIIWSRKRGNLPRKTGHLPPGRCRFFGVPYRVFPDVPLQKKKSL